MYSTLTSKGQITLPKALRMAMNLKEGDRIAFVPTEDGTYALVPPTASIRDLRGMFPKPDKPVSLEAMEKAIRAKMAKNKGASRNPVYAEQMQGTSARRTASVHVVRADSRTDVTKQMPEETDL